MLSQNEYIALLPQLVQLAREAGEAILEIYNGEEITVEAKADNSPLTKADLASHAKICQVLNMLTPNIPVLSEESADKPFTERQTWQQYWLIDPLDGTKEFIKRNGQFTVNIALIQKHEVAIGVVYAPALDIMYYAAKGDQAYRQKQNESVEVIKVRQTASPLKIVASNSHMGSELPKVLEALNEPYELVNIGSSLKICLVAEGAADVYPRLHPTSEWDTAAGQCILEVAGGFLQDLAANNLAYNTKEAVLNPYFIAFANNDKPWVSLFSNVSK